ncbi:hypothetical protein ECDEC12B_3035 [Escherichia coli DEC12B]|nr:hypothetical protein ECDEC12B_3035 [Escherichia coli DEC12B]
MQWHIAPLSSPSPEGLSYGQKSPRWETRAARNKQQNVK